MEVNASKAKEIHILYLKGGNYVHCGFSNFLEQIGCKVTTASNEEDLYKFFHESQINAFNIFDRKEYDCIIFDIFSSTQNSFAALRHLKNSYQVLPPMIGLTTPEQSLLQHNFKEKGFDHIVGFPIPDREFLELLSKWVGHRSPFNLDIDRDLPEAINALPVISLKTYSAIRSQAGKNGFSLLPLYRSFLGELENYIRQFIDYFESNERGNYETTIIAIRGLCATMGANQVYQVSNHIESWSRKGQHDQVGNLLPFLIEKFLILQEFIEQWQNNDNVIAA
jgi:CheY-like chemotaxis protein